MDFRKDTHNLDEALSDITLRKQRAAQARSAGTQAGLEAPRDVYLRACEEISSLLENDGYKYAKSGPHCRKRLGEFILQIGFRSSFNNVAGEHVRLCIQGTVFSPRIKKWRAAQSLQYVTDYVAGGQVGYLQQGSHSWSDWELADPANRGEAIADAVKTIREIAFPYFAQFQDLESLIPFLVENEMPSMSIERVVEFLMCFADKPTARMAAVQFFQRRPDLVPDYRIEFQRYADLATRDTVPSGYAQQMALASHLFDFGDVT